MTPKRKVTIAGVTFTAAEVAAAMGIKTCTLRKRLSNEGRIFKKRPGRKGGRPRGPHYTMVAFYDGKFRKLVDWATQLGCTAQGIRQRMKRGETPDQAVAHFAARAEARKATG